MKIQTNILHFLSKVAATNDEYPRARLAAALVKRNKILSVGINRLKSDPLQAKYGRNKDAIFLHAEIHAIKNALRECHSDDIKNSSLYICRVKHPNEKDKSFVWGLAKPCSGCYRAALEFGIKNIVYSTDNHQCFEVI
jgi:deoxycytidylate deaminase